MPTLNFLSILLTISFLSLTLGTWKHTQSTARRLDGQQNQNLIGKSMTDLVEVYSGRNSFGAIRNFFAQNIRTAALEPTGQPTGKPTFANVPTSPPTFKPSSSPTAARIAIVTNTQQITNATCRPYLTASEQNVFKDTVISTTAEPLNQKQINITAVICNTTNVARRLQEANSKRKLATKTIIIIIYEMIFNQTAPTNITALVNELTASVVSGDFNTKFGQQVTVQGVGSFSNAAVLQVIETAVSLPPSSAPTFAPTSSPSGSPSSSPSSSPSGTPSSSPSGTPSSTPSGSPSSSPSSQPSASPSKSSSPTFIPSIVPTFHPSVVPTVKPTVKPSVTPSVKPSVKPTVGPSIKPSVSCLIEFIKGRIHKDESNHCSSMSGGGFTLNVCAYKKSNRDDDVFYSKKDGMTVYDGHGAGSDRFLQLDVRSICNSNQQPSYAQILMTSSNTKYSFQVIGSNTKGAIGSSQLFTGTGLSWNNYVSIANFCKYSYLSVVSSARDSYLGGFRLDQCAPSYSPASAPVPKPFYAPVAKPFYAPVPKPVSSPVSCENEFIYGKLNSDDAVRSKSLSSGIYRTTAYAFKLSSGTGDMLYQNPEKSALALYKEGQGSGNDKFFQFDLTSVCSLSLPPNLELWMSSSTSGAQFNVAGSGKLGKLSYTSGALLFTGTGSSWNRYVSIPNYCKFNYLGIQSYSKDVMIRGLRLTGCPPTRAPVTAYPTTQPVTKKPIASSVSTPVAAPVGKPASKPNHDGHNDGSSTNLTITSVKGSSSDSQDGAVSSTTIIISVVISVVALLAISALIYCFIKSKSSSVKDFNTAVDGFYFDGATEFYKVNPGSAPALKPEGSGPN